MCQSSTKVVVAVLLLLLFLVWGPLFGLFVVCSVQSLLYVYWCSLHIWICCILLVVDGRPVGLQSSFNSWASWWNYHGWVFIDIGHVFALVFGHVLAVAIIWIRRGWLFLGRLRLFLVNFIILRFCGTRLPFDCCRSSALRSFRQDGLRLLLGRKVISGLSPHRSRLRIWAVALLI